MKLASLFVAAGALASLAGCSGVRVYEPLSGQNYYDGAFEYATQTGKIDTIVLGTPFAGTPEMIAAATTDEMDGATRGPYVDFTPAAWSPPGDGFRVVVMFNGPSPIGPDDICATAPGMKSAPSAAITRMQAAFCQGSYLISSADGAAGGIAGPQDPAFGQLVKSVTLSMIPPVDYNEINNDGGVVP